MAINGVDGKTLEQFVLEVLEVDSMFAAYCKVVDWKEELARLREGIIKENG